MGDDEERLLVSQGHGRSLHGEHLVRAGVHRRELGAERRGGLIDPRAVGDDQQHPAHRVRRGEAVQV